MQPFELTEQQVPLLSEQKAVVPGMVQSEFLSRNLVRYGRFLPTIKSSDSSLRPCVINVEPLFEIGEQHRDTIVKAESVATYPLGVWTLGYP
jgi:hypothetical protein